MCVYFLLDYITARDCVWVKKKPKKKNKRVYYCRESLTSNQEPYTLGYNHSPNAQTPPGRGENLYTRSPSSSRGGGWCKLLHSILWRKAETEGMKAEERKIEGEVETDSVLTESKCGKRKDEVLLCSSQSLSSSSSATSSSPTETIKPRRKRVLKSKPEL